MRPDYEEIRTTFKTIAEHLKLIADKLESNLIEIFSDVHHIDRINCRVKAEDSFMTKILKENEGVLKYQTPLKEVQDMVGARIVVYYKTDLATVVQTVNKYFNSVEENKIVPDNVTKFGYEGLHFICQIPSFIFADHKTNPMMPDFFELQIKTLYQHAWSQAEHGLGYKPGSLLSYDEERKLAFIAAQSWGADSILSELVSSKNGSPNP